MNCTKCYAKIVKGEKYHRTKRGSHHATCSGPDFWTRMAETLCNVSQLIDGWNVDKDEWGDWDESVRQSVSKLAVEVENIRQRNVSGIAEAIHG